MKNPLVIATLFILALFLTACTKPITKEEAEQKAKDYIIDQWTQTGSPVVPVTIQNSVFQDNEWRVTVAAEDDTGVIILDKKGNFKRVE